MVAFYNDPPRDLLQFQITREVTTLSKSFLVLLEDMRDFEDLLGDKAFLIKRKKVLDSMNSSLRNLTGFLDKFDIKLKG